MWLFPARVGCCALRSDVCAHVSPQSACSSPEQQQHDSKTTARALYGCCDDPTPSMVLCSVRGGWAGGLELKNAQETVQNDKNDAKQLAGKDQAIVDRGGTLELNL